LIDRVLIIYNGCNVVLDVMHNCTEAWVELATRFRRRNKICGTLHRQWLLAGSKSLIRPHL